MAGRENDFVFIKELLERGMVDLETFIARAELVADMPQGDALRPRLEICLGRMFESLFPEQLSLLS